MKRQRKQTNLEHNAALAHLNGTAITDIRFIHMERERLPDGSAFSGQALMICCGETQHPVHLLVCPDREHLRWFLATEKPFNESLDDLAMHACDFLEANTLAESAEVSRYQGSKSTVYVVVGSVARQSFEDFYNSGFKAQ